MMTAACDPLAGWTNAASHVPSGVLISTSFSTTFSAAPAAPVAAARPAATERETKSRRERSSAMCVLLLREPHHTTLAEEPFLFVAQRDHRIDTRSAARRNRACRQRDRREHDCNAGKSGGIGRGDTVHERPDGAAEAESTGET